MTSPIMMVPEGQYSHSLKLEESAKGIRISVHVYANNQEDVIQETFETYKKAIETAKEYNIVLAPVENK